MAQLEEDVVQHDEARKDLSVPASESDARGDDNPSAAEPAPVIGPTPD